MLRDLASACEEDHKPQLSHQAAHRLIQHKAPRDVYFPPGVPRECKENVKYHPEAPAQKPADISCAGSAVTARQDGRAAEAVLREHAGSNYRCDRQLQKHMLTHLEKGSQKLFASHSVVFAKLTWPPLLGIPCPGSSQHPPWSGAGPCHQGRSSTKTVKWKRVQFSMATSKNWVSCRMRGGKRSQEF